MFSFDPDVAGQPAKPMQFVAKKIDDNTCHEDACAHQHHPFSCLLIHSPKITIALMHATETTNKALCLLPCLPTSFFRAFIRGNKSGKGYCMMVTATNPEKVLAHCRLYRVMWKNNRNETIAPDSHDRIPFYRVVNWQKPLYWRNSGPLPISRQL